MADLVKALEGDEEAAYGAQDTSPEVAAIAADEREHAVIWERLKSGEQASLVRDPARDGVAIAGRARNAAEVGQPRVAGTGPGGRSGTLRAVIFGVSDGLVSNLSLVMGVAGAASGNPSFILLAGIAGLLAGAFSMAAGEYISMQSQRELFERQIALERAEMEAMPEEEEAELAASYRAKGFTPDEAARIAHRIFEDPDQALDMLVREELGLDPDELGSPWGAAAGSFVAFALGAVVPVIPYLFGGGHGRPGRQPRAQPRRAVRGRGRGQPADRSRHDLLRLPPARDRPGRRARDLRHRLAHRGHARRDAVTDDVRRRMRDEGLEPSAWANGPGDRYAAHEHDYDKVIVVERGSIRFGLPADGRVGGAGAWATGWSCRPARATMRSSGRPASPASRRTCRPARWLALTAPNRRDVAG